MKLSKTLQASSMVGLFLMAIFAPLGAGQLISSDHQEAITDRFGAGAPFGASWGRAYEEVTFYLHDETPILGGPPPSIPIGPELEDAYLDYEPPTYKIPGTGQPDPADENHKRVIIRDTPLSKATWELHPNLTTEHDFGFYTISALIYADCVGLPGLNTAQTIQMNLYLFDPVADAYPPETTPTAKIALQQMHTGPGGGPGDQYAVSDAHLGSSGNPLSPGSDQGLKIGLDSKFKIELEAIGIGQTCTVKYDTTQFHSFVAVTADSARLNTWITDPSENPVRAFPTGERASQAERRFQSHILHASGWSDLDAYQNRCDHSIDYQHKRLTIGWTNWVGPDCDEAHASAVTERAERFRHQILNETSEAEVGSPLFKTIGGRVVSSLDPNLLHRRQIMIYDTTIPDGQYRSEVVHVGTSSGRTFGSAAAPLFSIGLKEIELSLDGANATHLVNPTEPTEFRFTVTNLGAEDDTIQFQVTAASNWEAAFGGTTTTTRFVARNGGEATVTLRVVPPASAVDGASQPFEVTASSVNFVGEVDDQAMTVTVEVTDVLKEGANITLVDPVVDIFPGDRLSGISFRVRNTGHAADFYVVSTTAPTFTSGWVFQTSQPQQLIPAGSVRDYGLTISAPANAELGSFDVTIRAQLADNAAVSVTTKLRVNVIVDDGIELTVLEDHILLREENPDAADPSADNGATFQIVMENTGSREDTYEVTMSKADGSADSRWRYELGDPEDLSEQHDAGNTPFTTSTTQEFTVGAGESLVKYVTMSYDQGTSPALGRNPKLDVTFVSQNDPTVVESVILHTELVGTGTHAQGALIVTDPLHEETSLRLQRGDTVQHIFRAINTGNEFDALRVSIPSAQEGKWHRELHFIKSVPNGTAAGDNIACVPDNATIRNSWVCGDETGTDDFGVWSQVIFALNVTAASDIELGAIHDVDVTVTSKKDGTKSDVLEFVDTAIGTFFYEAQALKSVRSAEPGKTVALPFLVENLGTSGDQFTFTVLSGDPAWKPELSTGASAFIPGGSDMAAFLGVQVPNTATGNETFQVHIINNAGGDPDDQTVRVLAFQVNVGTASSLDLSGVPTGTFLLQGNEQFTDITVKATDTTGSTGNTVTFTADIDALPPGWEVEDADRTGTLAADGGGATTSSTQVVFRVKAPEDALGTSRGILHVQAETDHATPLRSTADMVLDIQGQFGITLERVNNETAVVVPGSTQPYVHRVRITNTGLAADTVTLDRSAPPAGWEVLFSPTQLALGPLESQIVDVQVTAPVTAPPRTNAAITIVASSVSSPGNVEQLLLETEVGFNELSIEPKGETPRGAPQETLTQVITVHNNGTLPDRIQATAVLATAGLEDDASVSVEPSEFQVKVNTSVDVFVRWALSDDIPSNIGLVATLGFESMEDPVDPPTSQEFQATATVLRYVMREVDDDGIPEYAVDRNEDTGDGFEEFRESTTPGGRTAAPIDLERYLTDAAKESFMVQVAEENGTTSTVLRIFIDGDDDGRMDHILDDSGNGLPDVYWDPDRGHSHRITVFKDVDADNVPDYFVDLNGDTGQILWDAVFHITTGRFTPVLHRDVDGDGQMDFIVDANDNGQLDGDETVLYTRSGGLVTVQKVDVDGDGCRDDVFDVDGDGLPDHFIPCGSRTAIPIVLKDVNGDGVLDWTFDADGDGKRESYYDPAAGRSSLIDTTSSFVDALIKYWYIGALFVLVLVLFVVLVAVTRR